MKRSRPCPVPECRGEVPKHRFYCAKHYELVPQLFKDAIHKSYLEMIAESRGSAARAVSAGTLRLALAYSYAVVCEKLGLPVPGMKQEAPKKDLAAAIKGTLNG